MDNRQLNAGCRIERLGDVLKLEYGKPLPKEDRDDNGAYPAYGANGIKCRTDKSYWDKPSIIVGRKGSAGEVNLTEAKFWALDVTYFVDFDDTQYDLMFLYYCLKYQNLQSLAKGVKPGINRNDVYALEQLFPPLFEQKRIVAILDEAFAGISLAVANAEKNLANARELFESYLNNIFTQKGDGWEKKKLGVFCERVSVGYVGVTSKHYCDESEGIPFIRSQNVRPGQLDLSGIRYITKEFHENQKKSQLKQGDLLFVRVGANRGDCCVISEEVGQINCANIVFARPASERVRFIEYFCQSPVGHEQLLGMTTGSAQGVINTKRVAELLIPIPTEAEQDSFIEQVDNFKVKISRLETIYQQKLTALNELKQSILKKAFTGELTQREENV